LLLDDLTARSKDNLFTIDELGLTHVMNGVRDGTLPTSYPMTLPSGKGNRRCNDCGVVYMPSRPHTHLNVASLLH
jgi:hypothetical protein